MGGLVAPTGLKAHVTCRQYVPATFRELRNICNLAQVYGEIWGDMGR